MDIQLKKGVLEMCVLTALKCEESYGYKIITDLSPYIEISESTLYPILKRLEGLGHVTTQSIEHNGRMRKYYMITRLGRERLDEFINDLDEISKVYDYIRKNGGHK